MVAGSGALPRCRGVVAGKRGLKGNPAGGTRDAHQQRACCRLFHEQIGQVMQAPVATLTKLAAGFFPLRARVTEAVPREDGSRVSPHARAVGGAVRRRRTLRDAESSGRFCIVMRPCSTSMRVHQSDAKQGRFMTCGSMRRRKAAQPRSALSSVSSHSFVYESRVWCTGSTYSTCAW